MRSDATRCTRGNTASADSPLPRKNSSVVAIATRGQAAVALQPVGDHHRTRLHGVLHERHQAGCRGIRYPQHPDAADGTVPHLGRNDHQRFLPQVSASPARLDSAG